MSKRIPPIPEDLAGQHMWLVHPDGSKCPDGCEESPDPIRLRIYELGADDAWYGLDVEETVEVTNSKEDNDVG